MKKKTRIDGTCSVEGCLAKPRTQHKCKACGHIMKSCRRHGDQIWEEMKRHALVKHPVNLLGAVAAALKGEDVF